MQFKNAPINMALGHGQDLVFAFESGHGNVAAHEVQRGRFQHPGGCGSVPMVNTGEWKMLETG
jgi:hypothetical protein